MPISTRTSLCIAPLAMMLVDTLLTLHGQTPAYWAGGYAPVRESNVFAGQLLELHPLAFLLGVVLWAVFFTTAIRRLPIASARLVAFAVMFGHTLGAATWLLRWRFGLLAVFCLFLLARALDTLIWDSRDEQPDAIRQALRRNFPRNATLRQSIV